MTSAKGGWNVVASGGGMAWVFLTIAIASEVFATIMLKVSEGFSKLLPAIAVVLGYSFSFFMLALALRTIGLSTAYAIWAGIGTVGATIAGVVIFGENLPVLAIVGIGLVVIGVVLLNVAVPH
jgi:multidrug transporter EmrE-like cation transporter